MPYLSDIFFSSITWASMTVPYIKPMLLGRTFDYSKSKVGNDIYPAAVRNNPLTTNHYKTHVSYSMIRRAKDIRDVLDVSGQLSVQIMAGLLDIKGRGSYLKDSSESGNFVEVLAKISYQTVRVSEWRTTYYEVLESDTHQPNIKSHSHVSLFFVRSDFSAPNCFQIFKKYRKSIFATTNNPGSVSHPI